MNRCSVSNIALLVGVVFGASSCTPEQAKTLPQENSAPALPDISAVYRADKELQTAFSMKQPFAEVEKLFVKLKAETSILRDQVSYDPRLAAFLPLIDKYERVARLYDLNAKIQNIRRREIDCIAKYRVTDNSCETPYQRESRLLGQNIRADDIGCNPVDDDKCDLRARIAEVETEATNTYMSLTHSQGRPK